MSTERFPRGSEWRKWDLHVHAPDTTLNNQYADKDEESDLEQFCNIIHDSDVAAIAIADYFSLDGYFRVMEKYRELYPNDAKLLLPNLELRLDVSVNRDAQEVNLHLVFRPSMTRDQAYKFLDRLNTQRTTGLARTNLTCSDLVSEEDFESATVSLLSVEEAIKATFGELAGHRSERQRHVLVIASGKGDGIRAGGSGVQRKKILSDEIDKYSDAFYGNTGSRDYFLDETRLESDELVSSKPVFDGCDAHSLDELRAGLGKHVTTEGAQKNITWIKADPTFEGLLQTLIEPAERVRMQANEPDQKEPYKVIAGVEFPDSEDFPAEVVFNSNLNAIIGSRSSGKSALLAFIAHGVDPDETVKAQAKAAGHDELVNTGPAAGKSWDDVAGITRDIKWASGEGTEGRVIYIPQNSLYSISEQPGEITKRIAPALFRARPTLETAYDSTVSIVEATNKDIKVAVDEWFGLSDRIDAKSQEIRDLGDRAAIEAERDRLQTQVDLVKEATELTEEEVARYEDIAGTLEMKRNRLKEIAVELDQLSAYVVPRDGETAAAPIPNTVQASLTVRPSSTEVPEEVSTRIDEINGDAVRDVISKVEKQLTDATDGISAERETLLTEVESLKFNNAPLIDRHEANEELSRVVAAHKKQVDTLEGIKTREKARQQMVREQEDAAVKIAEGLTKRDEALTRLEEAFYAEETRLEGMKFGFEAGVAPEAVQKVSSGFSQRSTNDYIKAKGDAVDYEAAQACPSKFLNELRDGTVTLNKNREPNSAAAEVFTLTKEVRFTAELDGDRIGGFALSSMTPGKQALFALTLILNESQEPWPLLIDQPEDDLDSRSIYNTIVPYLKKQKKERQIIMVSHNANLVIGADAEEVVVANQHGEDRPNESGRTFEYLSGALEHSQARDDRSPTILGQWGIREHACELLEGGEEAFQKRSERYNV